MHGRNAVFVLFGAWFLFSSLAKAQNPGKMTGHVIDAVTLQPVPSASVFLANTMIGDRGKEEGDGAYSLGGIPNGKYDLTISKAGYKLKKIPIEVNGEERVLDILLIPQTLMSKKEEVIQPNSAQYHKFVRHFIRSFIGETENAKKCEIINLFDIEFRPNEDGKTFTASSRKPIVIMNEALGYLVRCSLEEFKVDLKGRYSLLDGLSESRVQPGTLWFGELPPKDKAQVRLWKKERMRAYNGSIIHFMRSLRAGTLFKNDFRIYKYDSLHLGIKGNPPMSTEFIHKNEKEEYEYYPVSEKEVLDPDQRFSLPLKIIYSRESPEQILLPGSLHAVGPQQTVIQFLTPGIVIRENGYYENPWNYDIIGYMGWSQYIADLLPLEYPQNLKSEK
jgi:hypothetical protein